MQNQEKPGLRDETRDDVDEYGSGEHDISALDYLGEGSEQDAIRALARELAQERAEQAKKQERDTVTGRIAKRIESGFVGSSASALEAMHSSQRARNRSLKYKCPVSGREYEYAAEEAYRFHDGRYKRGHPL